MSSLERPIEIASRAHTGQVAPDGHPYIMHPLRMMIAIRQPEERIVAVLHDVIEKADDWTIERLRLEGFSDAILKAVDALTKRDGEDYFDLIQRAVDDKIARTVKIADINDHIENFPPGNNCEKYGEALQRLQVGQGE
jgi:(p)ppGpp synthase/HD superfamily hydrolase